MRALMLFVLICFTANSQVSQSGGETILLANNINYVVVGSMNDDPDLYFYSFLKDAERYGYDFSEEVGTLDLVNFLPSGVRGRSYNSCAPGYDVDINQYLWARDNFLRKKTNIYHEFGHALLNLRHACLEMDLEYWGVRDVIDIMTDTVDCPRLAQNDPPFPIHIDLMIERLFTPATQRYLTYSNCN